MSRRQKMREELFAKPKPVPGEKLDTCPGCRKTKRASFPLCNQCETLAAQGLSLPSRVTRCLYCRVWPNARGDFRHYPTCPRSPRYVPVSDGGSHDPDADLGPIDYLEGDG